MPPLPPSPARARRTTPAPARRPRAVRALLPHSARSLLPRAARALLPRAARALSRPAVPDSLRPSAAVSAEISPDGSGGEFQRARDRVLRWIEAHVGPLPAAFGVGRKLPENGRRTEQHRGAGGFAAVLDHAAGPRRTFGASLEMGTASGLPSWKAVVMLSRSGGASRLRTTLLTPRGRPRQRTRTAWVPGIVHELAHSPGLIDYGWRIHPAPWIIQDAEGVEGLIQLIGSRGRTRPVFATGLDGDQTNPEDSPLDPWDLAHRTAGLAHVVVVTGPMTYLLSDRVGRRLSVFGNAVRTYRPFCRISDRGVEHPMALPETVRNWPPGGPHEFAAFLLREAARTSVAFQAPAAALPEAAEDGSRSDRGGAADPDPFAEALRRPAPDGDGVHPLGAGDDTAAPDPAEDRTEAVPEARAG